jgi:flagellar hook-length control protein FliK
MSQTSLDYLFKVTGADRSFAVPRADEPRPPFGELFGATTSSKSNLPVRMPTPDERRNIDGNQRLAASSSTADDANGRPQGSSTIETAAAAESNERPGTDDGTTESKPPAGESQGTSGASEETLKPTDDEDDSTLPAEVAGVQATVQKHTQVAVAAGGADGARYGDLAAAVKEATTAVSGSNQNESGARAGAAAAEAVSNEATAVTTTDDDGADDGTTLGAGKATKKSRRTGAINQAGGDKKSGGQDLTATNEAAAVADDELAGGGGVNDAKESLKHPGGEQEQSQGANELNGAQQDRSESRARAETIAAANKAVAAVSAATTANSVSAGAESGDKGKQGAKPQAAKVDALAAATGRLHAQPAAGKRAGRGNAVDEVPQVDPARFVGRVAKAFQTAQERGGTLQLRLSPPELGALRLELTVKDGVMTASLETENASARRVLLDHLPALRERLAEQNIRVERFDVDVRRESGGQQATPQNQHHERQQQPESRRQSAPTRRNEEAVRHEQPIVHPLSNTSGINFVA